VTDEPQILDFLRANFARVHERLDRIDHRLGGLTTRIATIALSGGCR
jgi:hypothetical protein